MTDKPTEIPTSLRTTNVERKKELSSALKANMRRRKGQDHVKKEKPND